MTQRNWQWAIFTRLLARHASKALTANSFLWRLAWRNRLYRTRSSISASSNKRSSLSSAFNIVAWYNIMHFLLSQSKWTNSEWFNHIKLFVTVVYQCSCAIQWNRTCEARSTVVERVVTHAYFMWIHSCTQQLNARFQSKLQDVPKKTLVFEIQIIYIPLNSYSFSDEFNRIWLIWNSKTSVFLGTPCTVQYV